MILLQIGFASNIIDICDSPNYPFCYWTTQSLVFFPICVSCVCKLSEKYLLILSVIPDIIICKDGCGTVGETNNFS